NLSSVFDANNRTRTADGWKAILEWAVSELATTLRARARITAFTIEPLKPGFASCDVGVDVVFDTELELGFQLNGCVCVLQNVGEGVFIDADLLAFRGGRRVVEKASQHFVCSFERDPEVARSWTSAK